MDIGTLSLIVLFGLLVLIAIGVPLGFASGVMGAVIVMVNIGCLLYTSPSPRDATLSRMAWSA